MFGVVEERIDQSHFFQTLFHMWHNLLHWQLKSDRQCKQNAYKDLQKDNIYNKLKEHLEWNLSKM